MKTLNLKLTEEQMDALHRYACSKLSTKAAVVREWIDLLPDAPEAPRSEVKGVVITEDLSVPASAERLLGFHRAQQQNELTQWLKAD